MNEVFRNLNADAKTKVGTALTEQELQASFGLTADEAQIVKSLTETADEAVEPPDPAERFDEFLKEEYRNIATAHFNAGTTINQFFQFYLLIIGIPVTGAGVLARFGGTQFDIDSILSSPITSTLALAVAVSGFCMLAHLINLRLEALHYAKVVNGIRKHFYKHAQLSVRDELAMRALPRTLTQPRYWELRRFGWIILAFAVLNGIYWLVPAWKVTGFWTFSADVRLATTIGLLLLFSASHFLLYWSLVCYQDAHYFRTHIIGLDIDGVITDHRTAFCRTLEAAVNKNLAPASISKIPVHECTTLIDGSGAQVAVTQEDEHRVFNRTDYWSQMPAYSLASSVLRELKDSFHFKLILFTHRPWPNPALHPASMPSETRNKWFRLQSPLSWLSECRPLAGDTGPSILSRFKRFANRWLEWCRCWRITQITESWLKSNSISYDRLVVERGNVHVADPRSHVRNRFRLSEKWEIRVFIEDDLSKALRLADICDVVYLIDQPYNQADILPNNLVRVGKWDDPVRNPWSELKRHIRENL